MGLTEKHSQKAPETCVCCSGGSVFCRRKILVIGSSNTDMIIKSARIPKPGETILGGEFFMAAGGKGANQAVAAARAGGEVTFIAKVGRDMFGEKAIQGFQRENINTEHIIIDETLPSGIALIFVSETGENSIGVASGANFGLGTQDIMSKEGVFKEFATLLIQLEIPYDTALCSLKAAKENGLRTILNPAPARELSDEFLGYVDIITPNETEAELLTGIKPDNDENIIRAAEYLRNKKIEIVIITLGARGVYVSSHEVNKFIPSVKVESVDSTAAGDVFSGYLSVALTEGLSIERAIHYANRAAAVSVTRFGAQPSIPYRKEVIIKSPNLSVKEQKN